MITTETYGCDRHGEDAYQGCAMCDLEALREAAGKVTCATCDGEGKLDDGEWMPCPDCGDLRRLLGEKP